MSKLDCSVEIVIGCPVPVMDHHAVRNTSNSRLQWLAFAIGSAYAGFAGALYAPLVEFIDPSPFSLSQSFFLLLMVVAGGSGYLLGPFIGALLGVVLPEWLRFAGSLYLIIFATIVMLLLIACPQGVSGLLERGWAKVSVTSRSSSS